MLEKAIFHFMDNKQLNVRRNEFKSASTLLFNQICPCKFPFTTLSMSFLFSIQHTGLSTTKIVSGSSLI